MHSVSTTCSLTSMVTTLQEEIFIKLPCVCDVEFTKLVGRLMDETKGSKRHRIIGK